MAVQHPVTEIAVNTDSSIRVHAIQTGRVRVRRNQIHGQGTGTQRILNTFLDRHWNDWLPIFAWVVEHPEGLIVVDTGETARTGDPGYLPWWHPYYRQGVQFDVRPEEEIGPQLRDRWINPGDVRRVIMTHLHTDHAGGLHHFPKSEVIVDRAAYQAATGITGRVRGFLPNRWPEWLTPTLISFNPEGYGPFAECLPITEAGDVVLVPTPGHTSSHLSVVVRTPERTYFIAGDSSYTQELMMAGQVDGISGDDQTARTTLLKIQELAATEPVVYLPSHDPNAADRLARQEPVPLGTQAFSARRNHVSCSIPAAGTKSSRHPAGAGPVTTSP